VPTLEAIRTAINADSAVKALVAAGNDVVVAAALNDGRFPKLTRKALFTEGGIQEQMALFHAGQGESVPEALANAKIATDAIRAFVLATPGAELFWKYADAENPRDGLDLGSPLVQALIGVMVASDTLTAEQAAYLISLSQYDDVVLVEQIGLAMRGPQGGN
jgi:hypothetical protein